MPPIEPNDPNYPDYVITFDGETVRDADGNPVPGNRIALSGPHTIRLDSSRFDVKLRLELEHQTTDEAPNLLITVTEL
jgi:hypothetical protein